MMRCIITGRRTTQMIGRRSSSFVVLCATRTVIYLGPRGSGPVALATTGALGDDGTTAAVVVVVVVAAAAGNATGPGRAATGVLAVDDDADAAAVGVTGSGNGAGVGGVAGGRAIPVRGVGGASAAARLPDNKLRDVVDGDAVIPLDDAGGNDDGGVGVIEVTMAGAPALRPPSPSRMR